MAVTLTEADVAAELGGRPDQGAIVARMLASATALVMRYAPAAPDPIHDEATIRTCGYLWERESSALTLQGDAGLQASFAAGAWSALRHSGAMALLSPWKVRRAL